MGIVFDSIRSPIGTLTLVAEDDKLTGVYQRGQHKFPDSAALGERGDSAVLKETARQLKEYFAGTRAVFDLPLGEADTNFKAKVIKATLEVPYGTIVTYSDIAAKITKEKSAPLYVAGALNANKLTIVVPCHRVSGIKGAHYVADPKNKAYLLKLEAANRSKFDSTVKRPGFFSRLLR